MQNEINTSIAKNQPSSDNVLDMIHAIMYDNPASKPAASPDMAGQGASGCIASARLENCKNEMELLGRIIPSQSTMPILKTVRLRIGRGVVLFNACNIESHLSITLPADVTGYCEIAVPWGRHFRQKSLDVRVMPDDIVYVNGSKLMYRDADEFPATAKLPDRNPDFSLSRNDLEALRSAMDFTCSDELKPALMGFLLDKNRLSATDGHRLIIKYLENPVPFSVIIPKYICTYYPAMKKVIESDPLPGWIESENHWVWLKLAQNTVFGFRLIDEYFPDIDSVVPDPQTETYSCELSGCALQSIVDAVKPAFLNANGPLNLIRFNPQNIRTLCQVEGVPSEQVFDNPTAFRPPFEIQFNYYYLRDIIKRYSANDTIRIYLKSGISAALFIRPDENHNDETSLLMPTRIGD